MSILKLRYMYELQKPWQVENKHSFEQPEKHMYEIAANFLTLYDVLLHLAALNL